MFNYFNPESTITQMNNKTKEYTESLFDTVEAFQVSNIKSFDKLTNNLFTSYSDNVIQSIKKINKSVKEVVIPGK
jgi:uncharacterized protein (UPF0210 family)